MEIEIIIGYLLAYEEELRGIRISQERLQEFLEWVIENSPSVERFINVGVKKTITAGIVWRIKKGLKKIMEREKDTEKGIAANFNYLLIENGAPLSRIPTVVSVFLKEVKNHPLSERREVWNILYKLIPSKIEIPEEPLLIEEEAGIPDKEEAEDRRIIIPGEEKEKEEEGGGIIIP